MVCCCRKTVNTGLVGTEDPRHNYTADSLLPQIEPGQVVCNSINTPWDIVSLQRKVTVQTHVEHLQQHRLGGVHWAPHCIDARHRTSIIREDPDKSVPHGSSPQSIIDCTQFHVGAVVGGDVGLLPRALVVTDHTRAKLHPGTPTASTGIGGHDKRSDRMQPRSVYDVIVQPTPVGAQGGHAGVIEFDLTAVIQPRPQNIIQWRQVKSGKGEAHR